MGTAFAGIVRTPLTSVIMIFELTRDYSIIVPLMISNLIAFFISQRLQHAPIYEALALQENVYLPAGESLSIAGGAGHGFYRQAKVGQGDRMDAIGFERTSQGRFAGAFAKSIQIGASEQLGQRTERIDGNLFAAR